MLLLVTSRARWRASRPETPVVSASPMTQALQEARTAIYRLGQGGLESRGLRQRAGEAVGERAHLAGIIRVGGIAALLERASESLDVAAGIQRGGVAGVAAQQGDIILKALAGIVIRPEGGAGGYAGAVLYLGRP